MKECQECGKIKRDADFSYVVKGCPSEGRQPVCKRCGANKRETERRNRTWKNDALYVLWKVGRQRAKRAGLEWTIKKENIIIPSHCPVLGIPLFREDRGSWMNAPSLDRINNDLGYVPGNVMVISRRANILKKDASLEELIAIGKFYDKFITEGFDGVIM